MTWAQKPPYGTPINPYHPWATGLIAFWALNDVNSANPVELISGQRATSPAGFTWGRDAYGPFGAFGGTSCNLSWAGLPQTKAAISVAGSTAFTFITGGSAQGTLIQRDNANATWGLFQATTTLSWKGSNSTQRLTMTSPAAAGVRFTWALSDAGAASGSITASNLFGYINGIFVSNNVTGVGSAAPATSTATMRLGNDSATNFGLTGSHDWVAVWNYAIPAGMAAAISANPNAIWQMFQSLAVPLYVPVSGGSQTLIGAPAVYAETGVGATFTIVMPTSPAAYAETGLTATLPVSFGTSPAVYAETGKASVLGVGLPTQPAAFALTGKAAVLGVGLAAQPASYILTGVPANLTPSGSYAYSPLGAPIINSSRIIS